MSQKGPKNGNIWSYQMSFIDKCGFGEGGLSLHGPFDGKWPCLNLKRAFQAQDSSVSSLGCLEWQGFS